MIIIASVFKEIGWAEELGSGVRNIVKYSKVYSGTTPEFIDGDVFKTKISLNGTNRGDGGVNCGVKLSEIDREVLECISLNEHIKNHRHLRFLTVRGCL